MSNKEKIRKTDKLYNAIHDVCMSLDIENNLSYNDITRMSNSLADFCIVAINKFIVGQKKHGGNIIDKDLDKEFQQEFIDMFWYMNAKNWKQNEKEKEKENESSGNTKETEVNTSQVEQQSSSSR